MTNHFHRLCHLYKIIAPVDYEEVWKFQKSLMKRCVLEKRSGDVTTDSIIVVQHPPIYTLGRGGAVSNIVGNKFTNHSPIRAVRVERGGEITFHGPGQIIAYPIFDLDASPHKKDLHWYIDILKY